MLEPDQIAFLEKLKKENWTPADLLEWLVVGFRFPGNPKSFLPLEIGGNITSTTCRALETLKFIAKEDGEFEILLRDTIQLYLDDPARATKVESYTIDVWKLYEWIGDPANIDRTVRLALLNGPEKDLARTIISTMSSPHISTDTRLRFFHDLKSPHNSTMNDGAYWETACFAYVIYARLQQTTDPETRLQIWQELVKVNGSEVTSFLRDARSTDTANYHIQKIAREILGIKSEGERGPLLRAYEVAQLGNLLLIPPGSTTVIRNYFTRRNG